MQLDQDIIRELLGSFNQNEGSLFQTMTPEIQEVQHEFLKNILERVNPEVIVETGTHKANFCYFAKALLPNVKIHTFGNNAGSASAVKILNDRFGRYISFYQGDSTKTFSDFYPKEGIDFAWVDGGHTPQVCESDLHNCSRLGIQHICVDDYTSIVHNTVDKFVENTDYELMEVSKDRRGIAYLTITPENIGL